MVIDREPLQAGRIIGETFGILFRRFGYLFGFAVIPALVLGYIEFQRIVPPDLSGPISIAGGPTDSGWSNETALMIESMIVGSLLIGLIAAAMAHLVYRLKTGQSIALRELLTATARSFPRTYIVLLLLLVGVVVTASISTFAGLYLSSVWGITPWLLLLLFYPVILGAWALFGMVIPISSIERLWAGAFARSLHLTKGYRWRCLGIFVVVIIAACLILAAIEFPLLFTRPDFHSSVGYTILSVATYVLLPACLTIAATLLYVRLREIKEGGIAEQVEKVFA